MWHQCDTAAATVKLWNLITKTSKPPRGIPSVCKFYHYLKTAVIKSASSSFIKMVKGMSPLFIFFMWQLNAVLVYKPGKVWKAIKFANHVFIVVLGCYCSPRSSSRQKGRSYQAIRWGYQGEAIPPCHCCWNRTLPTKSDETYGSEKVSPQEQSEAIHQSTFLRILFFWA